MLQSDNIHWQQQVKQRKEIENDGRMRLRGINKMFSAPTGSHSKANIHAERAREKRAKAREQEWELPSPDTCLVVAS